MKTSNSDNNDDYSGYLEFVRDGYRKSILLNAGPACESGERGCYKTGFAGFDLATGFGGIPQGELIEVFGEADSGKTGLSLMFAAAVQREGGCAAFIDTEGKFSEKYAEAFGVDLKKLHICDTKGAEDIFDICEILAMGGGVNLVVIDSLTALVSNDELYQDPFDSSADTDEMSTAESDHEEEYDEDPGEVYESHEIVSRGLRRLMRVGRATGCTFVIVNQVRDNLESVTASDKRSTGGFPVFLRSALRIQLFRNSEIVQDGEAVGVNLCARLLKNSYSIRSINIWLVLYYQEGFSVLETLILNAFELGVLKKKDDGLYHLGINIGNDRGSVAQYLAGNTEFAESITRDMESRYK